jgi:hypothetical protein
MRPGTLARRGALTLGAMSLVVTQSAHAQPGSDPGSTSREEAGVSTVATPSTGWQLPATDLAMFGAEAVDQQIVVDPEGVVTAIWRLAQGDLNVIQASRLVKGRWTTPVDLSDRTEQGFQIESVADQSGTVTAVWRSHPAEFGASSAGYKASRFEDGAWSSPQLISTPGLDAAGADITVDASGIVTVVWARSPSGGIQAVRHQNGSWGTPVDISGPGSMGEPEVAIDPNGLVTAVWEAGSYQRGSTSFIQSARLEAGTWTKPVELARAANYPTASLFDSRIVVDRQGIATSVWVRDDQDGAAIETSRLIDGSWTTPVELSPRGESSFVPELAVDPEGVVTALWSVSGGDSGQSGLQASRHMAGTWQEPTDLVERGRLPSGYSMAVDSSGVVTVMYSAYDGASRLLESVRLVDNSWSPPAVLSPPGVNANTPRIVAGPRDELFVMWRQTYYIGGVLRFLRYVSFPPPSIQVSCSPSARNAACRGTSTGIDAGVRFRVFLRSPGSKTWTDVSKSARAVVQPGGAFTATIKLAKRGAHQVFFTHAETRSNTVKVTRP